MISVLYVRDASEKVVGREITLLYTLKIGYEYDIR